jgi:hypothetical protein
MKISLIIPRYLAKNSLSHWRGFYGIHDCLVVGFAGAIYLRTVDLTGQWKTPARVVSYLLFVGAGFLAAFQFHSNYEVRWPVVSRNESSGVLENSASPLLDWPLPSKTEISDLANDLSASRPDYAVIIYDDAEEKPIVFALMKAMQLARWPDPATAEQPYTPRLGIQLFVGSGVTGALEPLKQFCRKQLKTEPTILQTATGMSTNSIQITIGHNEAN